MKTDALKTVIVRLGVMAGMFASVLQVEAEQLADPPSRDSQPGRVPEVIVIRQGAAEREWLAANEYWINQVRAARERVQTWVLAQRLAAKLVEANTLNDPAEKRRFVRAQVLPLRLAVARSHEETIAAFLNATQSPGRTTSRLFRQPLRPGKGHEMRATKK